MLRMLVRDLRAGELTVLGVALVLAVAAMTSVGFLADRVQQALTLESHQLLGGDLLLIADHPWADAYRSEAARRGLQLAESATFPSMVASDGKTQLAEIKAVSAGYPLRGALRVAPALNASDAETRAVPATGQVWPDERLAAALDAGAASTVRVGALSLEPSAILTLDPDRGMNFFAFAPRLLLNLADLPATGLIQPGSRVSYRLHFAGGRDAVEGFRRWAESHLGRGERLESMDNARPEVRNMLERAQRYLRLAALLAVILAAVAMGLAADRYVRRHLDACAVLRCLGARQAQLLAIHGGEFFLFGLAATVVGCVAGFFAQLGLQTQLAGLIAQELPAPGGLPWLQGFAVGNLLVAGFILPPLLRLKRVPTVRVLRREWTAAEPVALAAYGAGIALLAVLLFWVAEDVRLGGVVLAGFAIAVLLYAGAARLVLALAQGVRAGAGWRYGLASLRRRMRATVVQTVALGLGITTLLLLTVGRGDLLESWKSKVPPDAPNRFLINIQPEQRPALADFLAAHGVARPSLEPMVRGRLVAVNRQPVGPQDYADERAQRLVEREFNLSWAAMLPPGNEVTSGRWHGNTAALEFSVEQGLAETLGLKLGDEIAYEIAGVRLAAPITSLRRLDWDSMRVNFFVIAPPGALESYPASYITSFHLPADRADTVNALVREFPNITVIDVDAVVRQLHATLDQVARAVEMVFGFALLAGIAVLVAALQSAQDERAADLGLMRALGARSSRIRAAVLAEFAALGGIAGLLGGFGAAGISWALARLIFHLEYLPAATLPLLGAVLGLVGVSLVGMAGTSRVLRSPPLAALRGD
ncbi:MAG: ABC transporter permease [Rhodocyclales bacterium GWA2_65_20]|nr:MAG: ABC transporter permease [Rhodocyclales bacterium GWA2_65_20]